MAQIPLRHAGNDRWADGSAAFQHSNHWRLVRVRSVSPAPRRLRRFLTGRPGLAPAVGFVHFARAALAAELRRVGRVIVHRPADAVHEEQRALVRDLALALDLARAHTLLAATRFPKGVRPMTEGQARVLVDRANPDRVLLAADAAAPEEAFVTRALAVGHLVNVLLAAVDATRFLAPALRLEELHGGEFDGTRLGQRLDDPGLVQFGVWFAVMHNNMILDANRMSNGNESTQFAL